MGSVSPVLRDNVGVLQGSGHERWVRQGAAMARHDPTGVMDSIAAMHGAESDSMNVLAEKAKAEGRRVYEERASLDDALAAEGTTPTQYLAEQKQGRIDLAIAAALAIVNVTLSIFVFLGFGPFWLAPALAFLALLTAGAVEEFFMAYDQRSVFREGFFLAISVVSLAAQFWLGSIRGLFIGALMPADVGPVTHAFSLAAPILRWGLGVLAVVAEVLCGYKFYKSRKALCSPLVSGVRARNACNGKLVELHGEIKSLEVEPNVRRKCREIGARQYLAQASRSAALRDHRHLVRAAVGAMVAVLVVALILLSAGVAFGAEPERQRPILVLIDLTKSVTPDSFRANCQAVAGILRKVQAGDRILVIGITDSFGSVPVLLDRSVGQSGYMGLQVQATRELLLSEWSKIAQTVEPRHSRTDIIGAVRLVSDFMDLSPPLKLFVLSDLRQSSKGLDIESPAHFDVGRVLSVARKEGTVSGLKDADVYLLGIDPSTKSAAYMAALKQFWTEFFSELGAHVHVFSTMRQVPEFGKE